MSMSMTNLVWALIVCAALLCALVEPSSSPPSMHAAAAARTAAMYSYDQEAAMMDSDTSRRILAGSNNNHYISYGAISRDWVPCHVRGRSYYNCNTRQRSNPYTRGCTKITHCARNNH